MGKECYNCLESVPNNEWDYNAKMCKKCSYMEGKKEENPEFAKRYEELDKCSRAELISRLIGYENRSKEYNNNSNRKVSDKNWQIRNMRRRLLKFRNQIDYLLKCPYATDSSYISDGVKRVHKLGKTMKEINK